MEEVGMTGPMSIPVALAPTSYRVLVLVAAPLLRGPRWEPPTSTSTLAPSRWLQREGARVEVEVGGSQRGPLSNGAATRTNTRYDVGASATGIDIGPVIPTSSIR